MTTPVVVESGRYRNITATDATLYGVALMGIMVSQASATPTLKVADSLGTILNTITPVAGQYYPLPTRTTGAVTITISGTVDCTVFYGP